MNNHLILDIYHPVNMFRNVGAIPCQLRTLIQKQSKSTRRAIAERLLVSDLEMGEQLLLKASIERG